MRPAGLVLVACGAALVVAGCASTETATPDTTTFPYSGTTLDVQSHDTATDLVATDRDDIRVTRWFDSRFATGVRQVWQIEEDVLTLRADCTGFANCDARFRVEVPGDITVLRDGEPTDLVGVRDAS